MFSIIFPISSCDVHAIIIHFQYTLQFARCHLMYYRVHLQCLQPYSFIGTCRLFRLFFPLYILNCNTLHFGDRFGPHFQACFYQHNCHYMMIVEASKPEDGDQTCPQNSALYLSTYDGKSLWVPMSYAVIRNLNNSAYDKELLHNRRARDISKCCTYDIIFTNTQAVQTCSWQINAVLNSSKITPHFHYKHIYKKVP